MKIDVFQNRYSQYKNPRNLVAGILDRKEIDYNMILDLSLEVFDVIADGKPVHPKFLQAFKTQDSFPYISFEVQEFVNVYNEMYEYITKCPYYLDGFVIKPTGARKLEKSGNPKDCIAIKFPPEEKITIIEDIEWNVGKTGELIPTLIVEPTLLNDTVVTRASGHNLSYVIKNKFQPHATITISKSGDIIPQARKTIKESANDYSIPSVCPKCNSELIIESSTGSDTEHLMCPNDKCPGRLVFILAGIRLFGVDNFGEKTLEKLLKAGIEKVEDFFSDKFTEQSLIKTGVFKKGRSLEILLNEIKGLQIVPLSTVIHSLQFQNVGKSIAEQVAKKIAGVEYSFKSLDRAAIDNIDIQRVNTFVQTLESRGITVEYPANDVQSSDTIKIEMTGVVTLENVKTKSEFIELFNGKVKHTKLNKDTDYLITNDKNSTSGKMEKARKLGVEILTYEELFKKLTNFDNLLTKLFKV